MRRISWNGLKNCFLIVTLFLVSLSTPTNASFFYHAHDRQVQIALLNKQETLSQHCGLNFNTTIQEAEAELSRYQSERNRIGEAFCLLNIGMVKLKLRDAAGAHNALEASLKIWRQTSFATMELVTLFLIGRLYETQGNTTKAINFYDESANLTEEIIKDGIRTEESKSIFATAQDLSYARLIDLKWDAGFFEEAFNYVERTRSRAFLDQLAYGRINFLSGNNTEILEKYRSLNAQIIQLRNERAELLKRSSPPEEINKVQESLTVFEKERENLWKNLQLSSPEIASLQRVDVSSLREVQNFLDADTTLVEYYVTPKRTLAFIITCKTLKAISLNVSQSELTQKINTLRELFRRSRSLTDTSLLRLTTEEYLQPLHKWLIAPLKPYLTTNTIGFVPHNIIHYLPFAALTDGNRYLGDEYSFFKLPNASMLRFLPKKRKLKTDTILVLGNPSIREPLDLLESAEQEAEAIAKIYNAKPLLNKDASESVVKLNAKRAEILHLAAHAIYNEKYAQSSTIYLAPDAQNDGNLEVREIYGLDLTAATNLVVLSACEGQLGQLGVGDEVVALNRAFLYAGTPSVIASLWIVSDQATTVLMQGFYKYLQNGFGKAEALRQAQMDLRTKYPEYRHPYFWAAFELTGDWGN